MKRDLLSQTNTGGAYALNTKWLKNEPLRIFLNRSFITEILKFDFHFFTPYKRSDSTFVANPVSKTWA